MNVVGLDQSYTGFGHCNGGISKKKTFPASKYKNDVDRLCAIEDWLSEWLCTLGEIDLVVMEGYANAVKFGREMSGELGWAVKRSVWGTLGIYPLVVPPNSLKKFVLNKVGKKSEMLLGVFKQWGVEFSDDNQADAYALEKFGECYLWTRPNAISKDPWHKYQHEAVAAVRKLVAA